MNDLRAAEERKEIQKRDQLFHSNNHHRFRRPATKAPNGSKLLSAGSLITGRDEVLAAWEKHFCELSASRSQSIPQMAEIVQKLPELRWVTRMNLDDIVDEDLMIEEIEWALKHIKCGKRGGEDNISAEHLKYGGEWLKVWLKQIFNAIIYLEAIPGSFKTSLIKPIYKGRGKDPLKTSSYRGVALSSVLAKLFEYVFLERLRPVLAESNCPHFLQSTYQKGISCEDAIFATQEASLRLLREGGSPFLSFFDLEKAFDSYYREAYSAQVPL